MKKILALTVFLLASAAAFSQSILTAAAFFQNVSAEYGKINDYEADLTLKKQKSVMEGRVSFKRPDLLRIDFTKPSDQVICFNGDMLTIYLSEIPAILNQNVESAGANNSANLATPQGLALMSRYYSVAYENGQDSEPLEEGSSEMVVKLRLSRRNTTEAFRYIYMSVNPDSKLIRRIVAVTPQNELYQFDFTNYTLNQGISDQRFIYDPPTDANNYNNFLFSQQ
jgi:outer membrane lipoprotein-sorting protein